MPGVGLLVGQDVPEAVRALEGGGGQVDGGAEEPEEAGGGEALLHQIDPAGGALHGIGPPGPAELSPEEKIGEDQPAGHGRHAAVPDGGQLVRQNDLPGVFHLMDHLLAVGIAVNAVFRGRAQHDFGVLFGTVRGKGPLRSGQGDPGGGQVERLSLQAGHHRLRRRQ